MLKAPFVRLRLIGVRDAPYVSLCFVMGVQ